MGRNKEYSSGVNELRTYFTKRGVIGTVDSKEKRAVIQFEQLYYDGTVAMYKVTNDQHIYYQIFKIEYFELEGGMAFSALYPTDKQFYEGTAVNASTLEEAEEILENFKETFSSVC